MNDFFASAIRVGLPLMVMILIFIIPIGTLAIIKMIKKLRRLNNKIILMVEDLLLALIDLNGSVLTEKK